jgi:hypothetical protein
MEYIARFATGDVKFEDRYMDGRIAAINNDNIEFIYDTNNKRKIQAADPKFFEQLEQGLTHALFRHTNWYQAKNKEHWTFDARKDPVDK